MYIQSDTETPRKLRPSIPTNGAAVAPAAVFPQSVSAGAFLKSSRRALRRSSYFFSDSYNNESRRRRRCQTSTFLESPDVRFWAPSVPGRRQPRWAGRPSSRKSKRCRKKAGVRIPWPAACAARAADCLPFTRTAKSPRARPYAFFPIPIIPSAATAAAARRRSGRGIIRCASRSP